MKLNGMCQKSASPQHGYTTMQPAPIARCNSVFTNVVSASVGEH